MKIVENKAPKARIICPWCGSILEVEKSDCYFVCLQLGKDSVATKRVHIICPCCKEQFGYVYGDSFQDGHTVCY